jgi:hypothetical protein
MTKRKTTANATADPLLSIPTSEEVIVGTPGAQDDK